MFPAIIGRSGFGGKTSDFVKSNRNGQMEATPAETFSPRVVIGSNVSFIEDNSSVTSWAGTINFPHHTQIIFHFRAI